MTLKCDRAYLHDVRDANTHYIRLYEGKSTQGKKIYGIAQRFNVKGNLSFANCVSFLMKGLPIKSLLRSRMINAITLCNCLNKKERFVSIFIHIWRLIIQFSKSFFININIFKQNDVLGKRNFTLVSLIFF